MNLNKNKPVCVIPARKGSKRIKNKNIINFYGKPLISYSIKTAIKSSVFSRVVVSTDCKIIKKIAEKYGAEVPFYRSKKLSNNLVGIREVLRDSINKLKSNNIDYHCILYATCPMIDYKDIKNAWNILKRKSANGLVTISKYNNHPLRSLKLKNEYVQSKWIENKQKNSQDLETLYHDTGSFAFYKTKYILENKLNEKKIIGYELPKYKSVDLDNLDDLYLLKKIFKPKE